jgi:hypothetical protein
MTLDRLARLGRVPHVCLRAFTDTHGRVNPRKRLSGSYASLVAQTHASRPFDDRPARSKINLIFAVGKLCLDLAFHVCRREEADRANPAGPPRYLDGYGSWEVRRKEVGRTIRERQGPYGESICTRRTSVPSFFFAHFASFACLSLPTSLWLPPTIPTGLSHSAQGCELASYPG